MAETMEQNGVTVAEFPPASIREFSSQVGEVTPTLPANPSRAMVARVCIQELGLDAKGPAIRAHAKKKYGIELKTMDIASVKVRLRKEAETRTARRKRAGRPAGKARRGIVYTQPVVETQQTNLNSYGPTQTSGQFPTMADLLKARAFAREFGGIDNAMTVLNDLREISRE